EVLRAEQHHLGRIVGQLRVRAGDEEAAERTRAGSRARQKAHHEDRAHRLLLRGTIAGRRAAWQSSGVGLLGEIFHTFIAGPLAIVRVRRSTLGWALIYIVAAGTLLGGAGYMLLAHKHEILSAIARYVAPEAWQLTVEKLIERLLASQGRAVLMNAA